MTTSGSRIPTLSFDSRAMFLNVAKRLHALKWLNANYRH